MPIRRFAPALPLCGMLIGAGLSGGCGDSEATVLTVAPNLPDPADEIAVDEPRYAVMSVIPGVDTSSAYVSIVPSLDEGELADGSRSLELPDATYLFGRGLDSRFYVLRDSAVLSAYDLRADGSLEEGPSLSFANHGVSAGLSERSLVFLSDAKAYLFDDQSLQAVIWDPSSMTITGVIDLGALAKPGWSTYFDYRPKLRGTDVVIPAYHFDESFSAASGEGALAFIDTLTDSLEVANEQRCGGFSTSVLAESGDLYVASDPYVDALRRVAADASVPSGCLLRVRRGERRFDPEFLLQVSTVVDGFGGGVARGAGGSLYVRAYDEGVEPIAQGTSALELYGRAAWRWWRLEPDGASDPERLDADPGAGTLRVFEVDGHAYATDASADYSSTVLVKMSDAGGPRRGLRVPGNVSGVVRLR